MSKAIAKFITFKPPYIKGFNSLTVLEKNANLEFMANLLARELDMVLFDELTVEDATYGNVYFIGYENASHASLCIFCPHINQSNYHLYCIEFVNNSNSPITDYDGYKRYSSTTFGYTMYQSSINQNYYWVLTIIKNDIGAYIGCFTATTQTSIANAINDAKSWMSGYNNSYCPYMMVTKDDFYAHYSPYNLYLIDPPNNPNYYLQVLDGSPDGFVKAFLDYNKKYLSTNVTMFNTTTNQSYTLPSYIKAVLRANTVNFLPNMCSICLIDEKYYLVISKYDTRVIYLWEIGTEYEFITENVT